MSLPIYTCRMCRGGIFVGRRWKPSRSHAGLSYATEASTSEKFHWPCRKEGPGLIRIQKDITFALFVRFMSGRYLWNRYWAGCYFKRRLVLMLAVLFCKFWIQLEYSMLWIFYAPSAAILVYYNTLRYHNILESLRSVRKKSTAADHCNKSRTFAVLK